MRMWFGLVVIVAFVSVAGGMARAQSSPATCGPGPGGGNTLQVTVNGQATTIAASPAGILLNGAFCGEPDQLEAVHVQGGALVDRVTLSGEFVPGATFESDWDELEVIVDLGGGADTLTVNLGDGEDLARFVGGTPGTATGGLRVNSDGDDDVTFTSVETVKLQGNGGNDELRADLYTGSSKLYLYGGDGDDQLVGSSNRDWFYGDAGNDIMAGQSGNDVYHDGPGVDWVIAGPGNDLIVQSATADAGDVFDGGDGVDTLDYGARTAALTVTIGTSGGGEVGENDGVGAIEKLIGGSGNDVLVGSTSANTLTGGPGDDSLYGLGGGDTLIGGDGNDHLVGDAGADKLFGDAGNDTLDAGAGPDSLRGGEGSDVLDGGGAADAFFGEGGDDFLYNDDGVAETVDCGAGTDDPEVDLGATDTFIDCELI